MNNQGKRKFYPIN